jgi:hypothetical protein
MALFMAPLQVHPHQPGIAASTAFCSRLLASLCKPLRELRPLRKNTRLDYDKRGFLSRIIPGISKSLFRV